MAEKPELSMAAYRQRTRRSLLTGGLAALAGFAGWRWVQDQPQSHNIPTVLRKGHEFNEAVWSGLFREDHQARTFSRSAASILRVNGRQGLRSEIDLADWQFTVKGPDGTTLGTHVLNDIKQLDYFETTIEHKCIEGWAQITNWGGARFRDFMRLYEDQLPDNISHVYLETPDSQYYVSVDIETMRHDQTMLTYNNLGVPIDELHGAPLRLTTPLKYGIKQLKRIGEIQFLTEAGRDYWGERGYDWYAGL
ncbi:MAG: molybdopterin-dependent oxidoreductase [Acidimicrobiia bacterium]|nr:molybdopterin-dependent oxidoreductase [Acidimicrobiia bacterium]MCY4456759.1 molybdopterin-dependent oxidoreductase [Acidimicrobiaceae bacterium]